MITLSPEDDALLKMSDLQLLAKCFRQGEAASMAKVCEDAAAEIARLRKALAFYANPAIYKPHPDGLAFDRRQDLYDVAQRALKGNGTVTSPPAPAHEA
jgi:hypothetical protein